MMVSLKTLLDNPSIWFISSWHLLVIFSHSGCDFSHFWYDECHLFILVILYIIIWNSRLCLILFSVHYPSWGIAQGLSGGVYFNFLLCKCGALIHTALWQMGGIEVHFFPWPPWYLASASGTLAQTDIFPLRGPRWHQTKGGCKWVRTSATLFPYLLPPLVASLLFGLTDMGVRMWSRVVISPISHHLIKSLWCQVGVEAWCISGSPWYLLGRAIKANFAFAR